MWQVRRVLFCFFRHYAQKFFAIEIAIIVTSNFITMSLLCLSLFAFLSYVWYNRPAHIIEFMMFMTDIIVFPFLIQNSIIGYAIYISMSIDRLLVILDRLSLNSWIPRRKFLLLCFFFMICVLLFVWRVYFTLLYYIILYYKILYYIV